jgi:hypothetical protein
MKKQLAKSEAKAQHSTDKPDSIVQPRFIGSLSVVLAPTCSAIFPRLFHLIAVL